MYSNENSKKKDIWGKLGETEEWENCEILQKPLCGTQRLSFTSKDGSRFTTEKHDYMGSEHFIKPLLVITVCLQMIVFCFKWRFTQHRPPAFL